MLLDTNNLTSILPHLKTSQLEDLVSLYCFSTDTVSDLIHKYKIKCEPNKLLRLLPLVKADCICSSCQEK